MPKCKRCGNDFEVPKFAIEMVFAEYCKSCIKEALKKAANMQLIEYMKLTAKQVGL